MRNPAVAAVYGHGRSRSKPLRRQSQRNMLIQHRGYLKMQQFLEHVIKKTHIPKKVHMKKVRFAVKNAIAALKYKKPMPKKKLNIVMRKP